MMANDALLEGLTEVLAGQGTLGDGATVSDPVRLSGGANMQTWRFDICRGNRRRPYILRRRPPGVGAQDHLPRPLPLSAEAAVMSLARRAGVPVPTVVAQAAAESPVGEALVMTCLDGEALPQRIIRDERYSAARSVFAFQCGEALAHIHSVDTSECPPGLRDLSWSEDLQRLQTLCDVFGNPSPVHQLALNWFKEQATPQGPRVLCHGDFRLGNLLLGERGLNAVLDWELTHLGFAGEDLGYLCANVWRFGGGAPVAGIGTYRELLDGYRSVSDYAPSERELIFWQLYAALGWGLVCLTMRELHRSGADASLERAAVGRRLSESEVDILLLLEDLES